MIGIYREATIPQSIQPCPHHFTCLMRTDTPHPDLSINTCRGTDRQKNNLPTKTLPHIAQTSQKCKLIHNRLNLRPKEKYKSIYWTFYFKMNYIVLV